MTIYVDELPKECLNCPCRSDIWCNIEHYYIGNMDKDCPLQSFSDYTKQVRKEVVQQVYKILEQAVPHSLSWSWAVINKELEKIQGETKCQKK